MTGAVLSNPTSRSLSLAQEAAMVGAGAAVTAVAAQVTIPWQPVPFTLQTLAVLVCGAVLGSRRGALSQLAYLAAGAAGLPIFAEFKAGPAVLFGPTAGYLLAFIAAAWLVGFLNEKGWGRSLGLSLAAMALGNLVILGVGGLVLAAMIGPSAAWTMGIAPFLVGDVLKIALAAGCIPGTWALLDRRQS
ncbi:MAG: biotin transporter BioY [Fimbriimonadaceae bacterium]|nr:biotin transporter BioY [Fimbriimonadaceae bacterium]